MMKCMQSWAESHGIRYQAPLPMTVERVHPPDMVSFDANPSDDWCHTCNNMGTVPCFCGGDLCVCGNNGEMPCPDCGE